MDAVAASIREAVAGIEISELSHVSFSAAMHSLIAVDAAGRPLTNSITWADQRSENGQRKSRKNGTDTGYTYVPEHRYTPCPHSQNWFGSAMNTRKFLRRPIVLFRSKNTCFINYSEST